MKLYYYEQTNVKIIKVYIREVSFIILKPLLLKIHLNQFRMLKCTPKRIRNVFYIYQKAQKFVSLRHKHLCNQPARYLNSVRVTTKKIIKLAVKPKCHIKLKEKFIPKIKKSLVIKLLSLT